MDDSRQVKNAEVEVTIEAERVASEVSGLVKEVNKYDDWGDASNEEIEEAMRKVENWKGCFSKIEDRIYSMKKNVLLYALSMSYVHQYDGESEGGDGNSHQCY